MNNKKYTGGKDFCQKDLRDPEKPEEDRRILLYDPRGDWSKSLVSADYGC